MANSKKKLAEKYGVEGLVNITRPLGVVFRIVTFIHQSGPISWCVPKLAGKWWWILFQDQGFLRGQFKRGHACKAYFLVFSLFHAMGKTKTGRANTNKRSKNKRSTKASNQTQSSEQAPSNPKDSKLAEMREAGYVIQISLFLFFFCCDSLFLFYCNKQITVLTHYAKPLMAL